jgi:hypothetical protein
MNGLWLLLVVVAVVWGQGVCPQYKVDTYEVGVE